MPKCEVSDKRRRSLKLYFYYVVHHIAVKLKSIMEDHPQCSSSSGDEIEEIKVENSKLTENRHRKRRRFGGRFARASALRGTYKKKRCNFSKFLFKIKISSFTVTSDFFNHSTMHGINDLYRSTHRSIRLTWSFIMIAAVVGAVYSCWTIINQFVHMPVVVSYLVQVLYFLITVSYSNPRKPTRWCCPTFTCVP